MGLFLLLPALACFIWFLVTNSLIQTFFPPFDLLVNTFSLFQKGFQAVSLPFGLIASKLLVSSPAMWHGIFPGCCSPSPSWIHLLPSPSGSLPLVQTTNPNSASLVTIINVYSLFQSINGDVKWDQNETASPWHPARHLPTMWHCHFCSIILLYPANAGPCFWKRQQGWYFSCSRDATYKWEF